MVDLHQGEARMLLHDDQVGAEGHLETTTDRHPVDRGDHRLEEPRRVLESAEAAGPEVLVHALATRGGFEVPAGREELLAATCQYADLEQVVIAQQRPGVVHRATGRRVDRVGLGPVEHHLEHVAVPGHLDCIAHGASFVVLGA